MLERLLKFFKPKTFVQSIYPELEKFGGLQNALNLEFEKINSTLRVSQDSELDKIPFTFATIENGQKFSQVYIGAEEKLYLPDFWRDGVCLANGQTNNISDLAQVLDTWLCNDISTRELADKFSFVSPNVKALAFDNNNEVDYTWNLILQSQYKAELRDFVNLAIKDEVLNKLFPFTSLYTLCFSRCTGYPFDTADLPNVTPKEFENYAFQLDKKSNYDSNLTQNNEPIFVVTMDGTEFVGEGNAKEALKIVIEHLPKNLKPARKGTADE